MPPFYKRGRVTYLGKTWIVGWWGCAKYAAILDVIKEKQMCNKNNQIIIDDNGKATCVANFVWKILVDTCVIMPNGAMTHVYTIKGINVNDEVLPEIKVPAKLYETGGWEEKWGSKAVIIDKMLYKKHVYILNKLVPNIRSETLCEFVGFFLYNGALNYVDHNGLITGSSYDDTFRSNLDGNLNFYKLPNPTNQKLALEAAIKNCLALNCLTDSNSYVQLFILLPPMLALMGLLVDVPFSILLTDDYDEYSNLGLLAQSFFGTEFYQKYQLAIDWTANEKDIINCLGKVNNLLIVINESIYKHGNHKEDIDQKYQKIVDKILRKTFSVPLLAKNTVLDKKLLDPFLMVVCNRNKIPKDLPKTTIRQFVYFSSEQTVYNEEYLKKCREYAMSGVYASVMSACIQDLLKNFKHYKNAVLKDVASHEKKAVEAFEEAGIKPHFGCVTNLAIMETAMKLFYHLALKHKIITHDECKKLNEEAWDNLVTLMLDQDNFIDHTSIGSDFNLEIRAALDNGRAHLLELTTGEKPEVKQLSLKSVGWQGNQPNGEFIGFIDSENNRAYLPNKIAIKTIKGLLTTATATKLPDSEKAFWIMLKNAKGLATWDKGGSRRKIKDPTTKRYCYARHLNLDLKFLEDYDDDN